MDSIFALNHMKNIFDFIVKFFFKYDNGFNKNLINEMLNNISAEYSDMNKKINIFNADNNKYYC